jgi:hypothetical protein
VSTNTRMTRMNPHEFEYSKFLQELSAMGYGKYKIVELPINLLEKLYRIELDSCIYELHNLGRISVRYNLEKSFNRWLETKMKLIINKHCGIN